MLQQLHVPTFSQLFLNVVTMFLQLSSMTLRQHQVGTCSQLLLNIWAIVTFGVYIGFGGLIDGYSALGVVYEVSLEVVMTTCA